MTFKDLQKLVQGEVQAGNGKFFPLFQKLQGKAFWYWDPTEHKQRDRLNKGDCCFNHIIGLARKDGIEKPMFEYERILYKALTKPGYLNSYPYQRDLQEQSEKTYSFKEKHVWVKKATGLGVTEFLAWLCLRNDDYRDSQMVIITGPNQELAIKLIKRLKQFFEPHGITFDSKETVIELNGCEIQAYPSNHIDAFRSLANPKFILLDECDFFRKNEQDDVRSVAERYFAKSDPFIVLVSTPNAPGGLFQKIEQEPFKTCIYKKLFLDYTYGLNKIYTAEEIDKATASPSFGREYDLKYLGLIGNVFSQQSIESCQKIQYNPLG